MTTNRVNPFRATATENRRKATLKRPKSRRAALPLPSICMSYAFHRVWLRQLGDSPEVALCEEQECDLC